ncbi:helix-turn-helix domain-containing protein [Variovorax sp. HJSM1_2]|uniref:helix-turn-helix domain-containing protein n=1 Tax=Variovorax sp. HJSM1_2 TaxID=3366263 RepID=UPI003BC427DD
MATRLKVKSPAFDSIYHAAADLHSVQAIDDASMKRFEASCLVSASGLPPAQIKDLRTRFKLSQSMFAAFLNTDHSTIRRWESGQQRPSAMAQKLLSVVDKHGLKVLMA